MKCIIFLRSYGDYVVALGTYNPQQANDQAWLVSDHLKPLHLALLPHVTAELPAINFISLDIQKGLLSFFTNKYIFSYKSFRELYKLRSYLRSISNEYNRNISFWVEQFRRKKIIARICGQPLRAIHTKSTENIYQAYARFWNKRILPVQLPLTPTNIIVFPDSRLAKKQLPDTLVEQVVQCCIKKNIPFTVALFNADQRAKEKATLYYNNFEELVDCIHKHDFIITADSLAAHIAQLLNKPHWIFYNAEINHEWLTPWATTAQTYSLFDEVAIFEKYINTITC